MKTRTRPVWLAALLGTLVGAAIVATIFALRASDVTMPGRMVVQTRTVPTFKSVDLTGASLVTIAVGGPRSVQVRGHRKQLDHVTTQVSGGVLEISTDGSSTSNRATHVTVGVRALDAVTLDGSGMIVATGVRTGHLVVRLPGSGVIRLAGSAQYLDVTLDGSGDAQLGGLTARDVHAALAGTGRIVVDASHSLDASVSGAGVILYGGDPPVLKTSVTGTGAIQRG